MTDAPITNQDLQMTLAQVEETFAKAADPAALFDGAKAHLGALYNNAEADGNNDAMVAISDSWNHIQSLAAVAQQNRESYLIAKDIAGTFQTQRDDTLKELEELTKAVEYMDTDHALVADLVESINEANMEQEALWYDDSVYETVYDRMQDAFGYDQETRLHLDTFMEIFYNNIELQPARKREFLTWLDAVKADEEVSNNGDDDDE